MLWPMVILFLLGGLQGLVGWIMVSSGVGTDLVYVDHIRLATHFIAAVILLFYVVWFALKITVPDSRKFNIQPVKRFTIFLFILITIQLIYGAFMAGTHAAKAAITWPSINGSFVPNMEPGGIFHNLLAIQFVHRTLAYIITILIVIYTFKLYKQSKIGLLYKWRNIPLLITLVQVTLGVLTLINYLHPTKIWLAIAHQLGGLILLISLEVIYFYSARKNKI